MNIPRHQRIGLAGVALLVVVTLIQASVPALRAEPWVWFALCIQAILAVDMLVYLVWLGRRQRDDYWRERDKDPKRPEI